MEPAVDYLADLLAAVGTVISSFVTWFTTMTTSLIANPIIQLVFGLGVALLMFRLVVGLIRIRKSKKKK